MRQQLYNKFIKSVATDPDVRSREVVLNWILVGSIILIALGALNTLGSLIFTHDSIVFWRLVFNILLDGLFVGLYRQSRKRQHHFAVGSIVVLMFLGFACEVLLKWSLDNPVAAVLFSLTIVMAGILLGSRYSLYSVIVIALLLTGYVFLDSQHYIHPDLTWVQRRTNMTDVISFTMLFGIIALVSWLFNRQLEHSLQRAQRSEKALRRERDSLERKVEERTRSLQAAQLEQMQEFYRFAELGHISTALFHDMANHFMSVSIDIEGLKRDQHSEMLDRIQENIRYIDQVVKRVRQHMQGSAQSERFNVVDEATAIIKLLAYGAQRDNVSIEIAVGAAGKPKAAIFYKADVTRFRQLITNLVTNAVEAYSQTPSATPKVVSVHIERGPQALRIIVGDHGQGIPRAKLANIFQPFVSSKKDGIGIGLFIVRKVAEEDFGGTVSVVSNKRVGTVFTISLPY